MSKKIMIALNSTWNLVNFRRGLIEQLLGQGYEVVAVSPEDKYVSALKNIGCQYLPIYLESKNKNFFKEFKLCKDIYELLKITRPNIVLSYTVKPNLYFSLFCHYFNIPIINTVTGLGSIYLKDNLLNKIVSIIYRIVFKKSKKVFFQNHEDLNFFLSKAMVRSEIAGIVPGSGINLQQFKPYFIPRNASHIFQFLFVGRILVEKGVIELIDATRLLKEKGYIFKIAFLGTLDPKNKQAISAIQMNSWVESGDIEYWGSTDDIRPYVGRSDCVVLPSYREGVSRALLEAAAMAKPIITTDTPGCRDVVDNGINGYLCQIKDPIDLALKMEEILLQTYEQIDAMGQMGRQKVQMNFSENIVVENYLKEIQAILK